MAKWDRYRYQNVDFKYGSVPTSSSLSWVVSHDLAVSPALEESSGVLNREVNLQGASA